MTFGQLKIGDWIRGEDGRLEVKNVTATRSSVIVDLEPQFSDRRGRRQISRRKTDAVEIIPNPWQGG